MFSINIQNNIVSLKDIEEIQLESILNWYNMSEDFRFATGMESPVSLEILANKYKQTADSEYEFFLGIHSLYEGKLVGILTGKLTGNILWINIMAVGLEFQGKGYGSISLDLLLKQIIKGNDVREAYLAVVDKNVKGRGFWLRNGFSDIRQVDGKVIINGEKYNVIIMKKRLYSR